MSQDTTRLDTLVPLHAGPLDLIFTEGGLRHIRLNGREVLRRVYVAVRDCYWETILGELTELKLEEGGETFALSFNMCHQRGEIDFRWRGEIAGDRRGTVTFTMDGEAHSTFPRNRIGFCVLHPINECAGQPCTVEHVTGEVTRDRFPAFIAPHQPFFEIRAITHEALPGSRATVRFEGETFEMEDQRNWTDASFKTYCTPLRLPFPVEIERGTKVRQRVALTLDNSTAVARARSADLTLRVGPSPTAKLPRIGLGAAGHREPLCRREIERLGALNLAHLRVDLDLTADDLESELQRVTAEARALNASIEAAIFLSDDVEGELKRLSGLVERCGVPISAWVIFHRTEKVTAEAHVRLARQHLLGVAPTAKFGAGTNLYFTEINRERPPLNVADLVCYSINPQVHAVDDLSLVENLEAQAETVRSARRFAGALPIAVTPVTLKPRFNPHQSPHGFGQPAQADERQPSLCAAAWTLGSLKYLAESRAASATYYETTGPRGVMERAGAVFPLYHVLADAGELAGGEVSPVESGDPLRVIGLALRREGVARLLLANLSAEAQSVTIEGIGAAIAIRRLNQENLEEAMCAPEDFRGRLLVLPNVADGRLRLELEPHEVVSVFY